MQPPNTMLALGLASLVAVASSVHGDEKQSKINPSTVQIADDNMGPAAFLWPPGRVWSGKMDKVAPCGSSAAPSLRTRFPLNPAGPGYRGYGRGARSCRPSFILLTTFSAGAFVNIVAQDDYYDSKISISYSKDPTSNDDFSPLVNSAEIHDLNPGHTCVKVPDAPERVTAETNATLQIIYKADWDAPQNQTFYACSDITFVAASDFEQSTACFNATETGEDDRKYSSSKGSS